MALCEGVSMASGGGASSGVTQQLGQSHAPVFLWIASVVYFSVEGDWNVCPEGPVGGPPGYGTLNLDLVVGECYGDVCRG